MPLSRQDLADLLGTTVETSIRIMSRWGKDGVVQTREGGFPGHGSRSPREPLSQLNRLVQAVMTAVIHPGNLLLVAWRGSKYDTDQCEASVLPVCCLKCRGIRIENISSNPLASVCGRVCAAPCEDACRRNWIDGAVMIRPLKRFVTEKYGAESSSPETYRELLGDTPDPGCSRLSHLSSLASLQGSGRGHKVAVVGRAGRSRLRPRPGGAGLRGHGLRGPARHRGHAAIRDPRVPAAPGGHRPRGLGDRTAGRAFETGVNRREPLGLREREGFEACFLSVGASRGRDLQIPGSTRTASSKPSTTSSISTVDTGWTWGAGVVIGGGSVAFDAARTAVREFYHPMEEIEMTAEAVAGQPAMDAARGALRGGASEVHVVSLESLAELPAAQTVQGRDELRRGRGRGDPAASGLGPAGVPRQRAGRRSRVRRRTRVFDDDGRFNPISTNPRP